MAQILLPYKWMPRPDQMEMWQYLESGGNRVDMCAHRRWGKDDVSLHWSATAAHRRIGTYWHMLPEAAQARKAIWEAINPKTGKRRIDEAFPPHLRERTVNDEMFIKFKCGSTWQVVGSDNYNSLVGSPPVGVVFSEWALARPEAWSYIRPILQENGGYAFFIWTPRGRNHATRAFESRTKDPAWYARRVPAADVVRDEDNHIKAISPRTPVFSERQLWQELQEMIAETGSIDEGTAKFASEYLVDFDAPVPGSYFAAAIKAAQTEGRITKVPYTPDRKVCTSWDLGIDDYTAIWFFQKISLMRVNVIAYYETNGVGFDTIVKEAFGGRMNWQYEQNYLPHDIMVRELGAGGRTRRETLRGLGIKPIRVGVAMDPEDRINASRRLLPYCHFDEVNTQVGVDHMKRYARRYNRSLGVFVGPIHDEASHPADAFGEFAVNAKLPEPTKKEKQTTPGQDGYRKGTRSMFANSGVPHWKVA